MSRRAWNDLASDFENAVCDISSTSADQISKVVAQLSPNRRQTLVDAGCGIGTFSRLFGNQFGRVVGFDFAAEMVRRARSRCRGLKHASWQTLALEDAAEAIGAIGHLVVCLNVITSPDEELRSKQWASLAGLARPGGSIVVVVPAWESAKYVAEMSGEGDLAEQDLIRRTDTLQKHYRRAEVRKLLNGEGAEVISVQPIHYPWTEDGLKIEARKSPWDWLGLAQIPR